MTTINEQLRQDVRDRLFRAVVFEQQRSMPDFGLTKSVISSHTPASSSNSLIRNKQQQQHTEQQHNHIDHQQPGEAETGGWLRRARSSALPSSATSSNTKASTLGVVVGASSPLASTPLNAATSPTMTLPPSTSSSSSSSAKHHFGEATYFVINDQYGYLCPLRNGELMEDDLVQFHRIVHCTALTRGAGGEDFFFRLAWLPTHSNKLRQGDFAPANTRDRDLCVSWTCALQFRSKTYDRELDVARNKAVKVALWCQSVFRGIQGRRVAARRKTSVLVARQRLLQKQQQSTYAISRMVSGLLYDDPRREQAANTATTGIDEEEDDEEESSSDEEELDVIPLPTTAPATAALTTATAKPSKSFFASLSRSLLPAPRSASSAHEGGEAVLPPPPQSRRRSFRISSSSAAAPPPPPAVEPAPVVALLETVEDEIWENQRWQSIAFRGTTQARGWSEIGLMLTDRGAFSDRQGLLSFPSLAAIGVPHESGWRVTHEWRLASASAASATTTTCNAEGWTYGTTFGALDSNLASGRENTSSSPRWLVRRRRWVRTRVRPCVSTSTSTSTCSMDEFFAVSGWLGMQGIMTGRWTNALAFIPHPPVQNTYTSGAVPPAFCFFKDTVRLFDSTLQWRINPANLAKRDVKVKHLDNACRVSDALATQDRPGLFSLHLTGEAEPRVLNAFTAEARTRWVSLLQQCVRDSPAPDYDTIVLRRSMRKGAVWELARASGAVKGVVDSIKRLGGGVTGGGAAADSLHRVDSDPDLALIQQLREDHASTTKQQGEEGTPPTPSLSLRNFKMPKMRQQQQPQPPHQLAKHAQSAPPTTTTTCAVVEPLELHQGGSSPTTAPTTAPAFEPPPAFDNVVFDGVFDLSVDDLDLILFQEEDYTRDCLQDEKMTEVELDPWTNGTAVGSEHRRRYKMPRVGVVPPGPSLHSITRVVTCPTRGYVLDHVVSTPDVPFGTTFNVEFRYVLEACNAATTQCRLVLSQRVVIHKPSMAQSFIRSGTKREITSYYKNVWNAYTRKWIADKRPNLLTTSTGAAGAAVSSSTTTTVSPQAEDLAVAEIVNDNDNNISSGGDATATLWRVVYVLLLVCVLLVIHSAWLHVQLAGVVVVQQHKCHQN